MSAIVSAIRAPKATLRTATHTRALPHDRFFNREFSRLDFDGRVLSMAENRTRPLAERIRFLAIVSDSLDEFFQVRVAGLHGQLTAPIKPTSPAWSKAVTRGGDQIGRSGLRARGVNAHELMQRDTTLVLVADEGVQAV